MTLEHLSSPIDMAATAVLATGLALIAVSDIRTFRIPDRISLPMIGLGLVHGAVSDDLNARLAGAALGYLLFRIIEALYRHLRGQDGLGRGDAKLLALGGGWCGIADVPLIVLGGAATALIFGLAARRPATAPVPFGPFLAGAIFVMFLVK